jgi:tetratricopeptide (TPR) repeat protein
MYMLLSETPGLETLRDTRINYDSRLWDDVRGAGGYNTVTGVEDVERTIFDRYNTVTHELTHQVHGVLTAEQSRTIQDLYRQAKTRDEQSHEGFMSRYAGGSVFEYFAEGANALVSPKRDAWDPREVVRERLDTIDPALRELVRADMALTDVSASYAIAYTNAGDDRVERGDLETALTFYQRALLRAPTESRALESRTRALVLHGARDSALAAARRGLAAHPENGSLVAGAATAWWYGGRGLDSALVVLRSHRPGVLAKDRDQVDVQLGALYFVKGDAMRAIAAYDSALASQNDLPEALWGKAAALALDHRWTPAFELYERAVRARTGVVELRCDYARDLIRAGRLADATRQLDEARLLDAEQPTAEALRGWLALERNAPDSARVHAEHALAWGPWCDLARIVLARAESRLGDAEAATGAEQPVRDRITRNAAPEYTFRASRAEWVSIHELPAVERELLATKSPKR